MLHISFRSFCSLSCDRPIASSKRVLHRVRSSASCVNLQYSLFSWRSFSSCLRLLPRLPDTSILHYIFPWISCFRRPFLPKMWPIRPSFCLLFVGYSCPPWLSIILHFLHDWSNWASLPFSSTTFKNFTVI